MNSVGNLAGFFGPTVLGWLKDQTGQTDSGLYILAGFLLLCAPLIFMLPAKLVSPAKPMACMTKMLLSLTLRIL